MVLHLEKINRMKINVEKVGKTEKFEINKNSESKLLKMHQNKSQECKTSNDPFWNYQRKGQESVNSVYKQPILNSRHEILYQPQQLPCNHKSTSQQ